MGGRRDIVDDQAQVAERVRKLEIMPMPGPTAGPKFIPNREDLDAILGHVLMLGIWENPQRPGVIGQTPFVGPAAQYLWAAHDQEGYQNTFVGEEWTRFLQVIGALPPLTALAPFDMSEGGVPPGAPSEGPHTKLVWPGSAPPVAHTVGNARFISLWGLPPGGTWGIQPEGETPGFPVDVPDLNDDGLYRVIDGELVIARGALVNSNSPILGRTNTWGFTPRDCGGPNDDRYNPYTNQGLPIPYESGPQPCPEGNAAGAVFYGGSITRAKLFLSGLDVHLAAPPKPLYGELSEGARKVDFSAPGLTLNLIDYLHEAIPVALSLCPAVAGFYERVLPYALAQQRAPHHYKHLSLRINMNWRGRVEAQIHDQMATLRGTVTTSTGDLNADPVIAAWPLSYGAACSPSEFPYLLPRYAQGAGGIAHAEARTPAGEPVPIRFNSGGALGPIGLIDNWILENDTRHYPTEDFTLILDGVTFPLEYPPAPV